MATKQECRNNVAEQTSNTCVSPENRKQHGEFRKIPIQAAAEAKTRWKIKLFKYYGPN